MIARALLPALLALMLPAAALGADRLTLMLDWLPNPDDPKSMAFRPMTS